MFWTFHPLPCCFSAEWGRGHGWGHKNSDTTAVCPCGWWSGFVIASPSKKLLDAGSVKSQPARLAFDYVPEVRGTMIYDLRGLESFPTLPHANGVLSSGTIQPYNGIVEKNLSFICGIQLWKLYI